MRKRKKVYICDQCFTVGLPKYVWAMEFPPDNWGMFANMDLCDKCYAKIKRIFEEDKDASNKQDKETAG